MSKHLTWEDLAEIYKVRTGGRAKIRPMDEIYQWAVSQPDIEETAEGFLIQVSKKPTGPRKTKTFIAVEQLLAENTSSKMTGVSPRDSDTELYIQYLQRVLGANLTAPQLEVIRSINYESISRARRKLQEKGQYHGSPEVMRKRRLKSYEVEQTAPKETAAGLQRRIERNE